MLKTLIRKVFIALSAFALLITPTSAEWIDAEISAGQYTITSAYEYPVEIGSDEWNAMSSSTERKMALALPDGLEKSMTTEALLETVIANPYLIDIYFFDTLDLGYRMVSRYVDGLSELMARSDFMTVFQDYTSDVAVTKEAAEYTNSLQEISLELLSEIYLMLNANVSTASIQYNICTLYTPNGTPVDAYEGLTYSDHNTTISRARTIQEQALVNYPSATVIRDISSSTPSYNCHSYAWEDTSSVNPYWIDDPSAYMDDGSYSETSARAGTKVYWSGLSTGEAIHSGIMLRAASNGSSASVISKWGMYALIQHDLNDCPYSTDYGSVSISIWN